MLTFSPFTSSVPIPLSKIAELIPQFIREKNERYDYYKDLYDPKAIAIAMNGGAFAAVECSFSANKKASTDEFVSKDVKVVIPGKTVEDAIREIVKKEAEELTRHFGKCEPQTLKWEAKTIPYTEGRLKEDPVVVTVECSVLFLTETPKTVSPESNGKQSVVEEELAATN